MSRPHGAALILSTLILSICQDLRSSCDSRAIKFVCFVESEAESSVGIP